MQTITLADAQARLPELIDSLLTEKEIVITRDNQTVAVILPKSGKDSADVESAQFLHNGGSASTPRPAPRTIRELKTFSVGKILKPDFNREEVWDEMSAREE